MSTMTTTKLDALAVRAEAAAVLHMSGGSCDTEVTGDLRCFRVPHAIAITVTHYQLTPKFNNNNNDNVAGGNIKMQLYCCI